MGVKSVISKASGSKADLLIEPGDKIHFGSLFLEVGMQVLLQLVYPFIKFLGKKKKEACPEFCSFKRRRILSLTCSI